MVTNDATVICCRFWLVDYQSEDVIGMARTLYEEVCKVPFTSRFVVFGKRHAPREARLRVFCMTDDKVDKTLETQQSFTELARSRDIEVSVISVMSTCLSFAAVALRILKYSCSGIFAHHIHKYNKFIHIILFIHI